MGNLTKGQRNYSKLTSVELLNLISKGTMNESEAKLAATVCERRFPTPNKLLT